MMRAIVLCYVALSKLEALSIVVAAAIAHRRLAYSNFVFCYYGWFRGFAGG
jgi:hypothetical protein